jgi:predicted metal-dependent peptidase
MAETKDSVLYDKIQKILNKLKISLMSKPNTVFYTTILFSLITKLTDQVPRAGVDSKYLYINPLWFDTLEKNERIGLLCHEVLHIALGHLTRLGNREHELWNKAGDIVINLMLIANGYVLSKEGIIEHKYADMTTEQVYDALVKEQEDTEQTEEYNSDNYDIIYPKDSTGNSNKDIQTSAHSMIEVDKQVKDLLSRAMIAVESSGDSVGSLPGNLQREIQNQLNPKLPWNVILQNYMSSFVKNDYSWKKPNRRYFPDYYLPSMYSEAICDLTIIADLSGSVDQQACSQLACEIQTIKEILKPNKITFRTFDTKLYPAQDITESTDIMDDLEFRGGGGTSIYPVLDYIEKERPEVTLIFTDGYFWSTDHKIDTPVIWLIHDNPQFTYKFGTIIHYESEKHGY